MIKHFFFSRLESFAVNKTPQIARQKVEESNHVSEVIKNLSYFLFLQCLDLV